MRALAAVLVALIVGTLAAPVTCLGWESSPAQRRACCQRASHDHCHDQTSADTCCAAHEQGIHSASTPASSATTAGSVALLPAKIVDGAAQFRRDASQYTLFTVKRLHDPPVLFSPPLRI